MMKTVKIITTCIFAFVLLTTGRAQVIVSGVTNAPVISAQPADQTANFGSDVSFSVTASGSISGYQWQKNGAMLWNYRNVAGARQPVLKLIGVSQRDAASYSVIVWGQGGAVTSSVAVLTVRPELVFRDNFESGVSNNWNAFPRCTGLADSTEKNHSANGANSALLQSSSGRIYHNLGRKLYGRVLATYWIYDDGGEDNRFFGELRAYSGSGVTNYVSPGGLKQLFAIGRNVVATNFALNRGGLAGETPNPSVYQARVDRGTDVGWFNLDGPNCPQRSAGWHKFQIHRRADGTTIDFLVDGVIGRTIQGANYWLLDSISIGSMGYGDTAFTVWFDDVSVETYPVESNWQTLDSRGDGIADWVKARELGLDPTDLAATQITTVSESVGTARVAAAGTWSEDNGAIFANDLRGSADYVLTAPTDDAYRIEVEAREHRSRNVSLPLIVSLDGQYLARITCSGASNTLAHSLTPFIKAGQHTVRLYWDNASGYNSLHLPAVRLQSAAGPTTASGMKQWVSRRLQAQTGLTVAPASSRVSPVCIEGRGQYLSMMSVQSGTSYPLSPVAVSAGAGHEWYANVPLSKTAPTRVEVSYQNGGLTETNDITWDVTNVLLDNNTTIRKGDALLFVAKPASATNGAMVIRIVGVGAVTNNINNPVQYRFDQPGTYTVQGLYVPQNLTGSITVKVVDAPSFNGSIAAWVGKHRFWDCADLPPEAVLDADPRLTVTPSTNGLQQYAITSEEAVPHVLLARLGANGPVLGKVTVDSFRLMLAPDSYLRIVETNPDGSQLIETAFVMSPVVPEVSIKVKVIVSGVTFDDGTVTKTLQAADFNELGICRIRFLRAAGVKTSVCHTVKAYDGTYLIGWPSLQK